MIMSICKWGSCTRTCGVYHVVLHSRQFWILKVVWIAIAFFHLGEYFSIYYSRFLFVMHIYYAFTFHFMFTSLLDRFDCLSWISTCDVSNNYFDFEHAWCTWKSHVVFGVIWMVTNLPITSNSETKSYIFRHAYAIWIVDVRMMWGPCYLKPKAISLCGQMVFLHIDIFTWDPWYLSGVGPTNAGATLLPPRIKERRKMKKRER